MIGQSSKISKISCENCILGITLGNLIQNFTDFLWWLHFEDYFYCSISKTYCKFLNLIFKSDLQNTILIFWRSLLMIAFKVCIFLAPFLQFFSAIFTVFFVVFLKAVKTSNISITCKIMLKLQFLLVKNTVNHGEW